MAGFVGRHKEVDFSVGIDEDGILAETLATNAPHAVVVWTLINEMSLQYHPRRTEVYRVLDGELLVYRGMFYPNDLVRMVAELQEVIIQEGYNIVIPRGTVHCPVNLGQTRCRVLELSDIIPYDNDDIVRIYDMYGGQLSLDLKAAGVLGI